MCRIYRFLAAAFILPLLSTSLSIFQQEPTMRVFLLLSLFLVYLVVMFTSFTHYAVHVSLFLRVFPVLSIVHTAVTASIVCVCNSCHGCRLFSTSKSDFPVFLSVIHALPLRTVCYVMLCLTLRTSSLLFVPELNALTG